MVMRHHSWYVILKVDMITQLRNILFVPSTHSANKSLINSVSWLSLKGSNQLKELFKLVNVKHQQEKEKTFSGLCLTLKYVSVFIIYHHQYSISFSNKDPNKNSFSRQRNLMVIKYIIVLGTVLTLNHAFESLSYII